MKLRHLAPTLMLAWAALLLSACTITFIPDTGVRPRTEAGRYLVIERFESARSGYRVGDSVTFRIRTDRPGFVTLTAFDPDGSTYVIARNVPVGGNRIETIPGPGSRISFLAVPPTGWHMVRAHFTPERTPERVSFVGIGSIDAWTAAIVLEIRGYGFDMDAVAETRFEIRR